MRPQDFYTNHRASQGAHVDLVDPAGNREWVKVRSVLSPEFAEAVGATFAKAIEDGATEDQSERKRRRRFRNATLTASLIAEWSLPAVINPVELLVANPKLRRQIERIAETPTVHFGAANG